MNLTVFSCVPISKSVYPNLILLDNENTLVLTGKVGTQHYFCVFCVQSYKWFEKVTIQNGIRSTLVHFPLTLRTTLRKLANKLV